MIKRLTETTQADRVAINPIAGIELLRKQIVAGEQVLNNGADEDEYSTWEMLTRNYLQKAFGRGSSNISSVTDVGKYGAFPMDASNSWWSNHRRTSLRTQLSKLTGLIQLLETEA